MLVLGDVSLPMWLYLAGALLAGGHVLLNKQEPRSAGVWLLILFSLPGLGLVAYLFFGIDRVTRKQLLKEAANIRLRQEYSAFLPSLEATFRPPEHATASHESAVDFPQVLDRICTRPLLGGNRVKLYSSGDRVYQRMLDAIEEANSSINLQTYIFLPDRVGRQLTETLIRRARDGVEVRLLYDVVGSIDALWFLDELSGSGVTARPFHPLSPFKRRWQVNLRNHRKLLLVDGVRAFTGGMNITEKHLADHPLLNRVKDYHFEIQGPTVHEMQEWFVEDWYYATGETLLAPAYFPPIPHSGDDLVRVITSGPDNDLEQIYQAIFAAIVGARSQIIIATPYFIPDKALLTALQLAATRGVDITLVVPGHSDHPFVHMAARTFYESLLSNGIKIYEREPPFLHAKAMIIDEEWALIGSANMDMRSFRLNFEANLEVRSPALIKSLMHTIHEDIKHSRLMDLASFRRRPVGTRLIEAACGVWSPML